MTRWALSVAVDALDLALACVGLLRARTAGATYARARRTEAAEREAERLRHGRVIEGDFVCPEGPRAQAAEARLREALAALGETRLDVLRQKRRAEVAEDEVRRLLERARGAS